MGLACGKCTSTARLDGVTAVITGCNTGIGKVTAEDFYKRGARVIMACRNVTKAQEALDEIKKTCVEQKPEGKLGELLIKELNLQSLASIRKCAEDILKNESKIQLLINNAGIMACPQGKTDDDFELQFGTNHLGHFLLTILLLPKLIASAPSRIVNVSSIAHAGGQINFDDLNWERRTYRSIPAYQQSKLANVLFTKELARRLENTGVTTYALHPGVIKTELGRHLSDTYFKGAQFLFSTMGGPFMKTPLQGAQTTIYCAVAEETAQETGLYYSDCKVVNPSTEASNEENARRLWEESLKLVGISSDPYPAPAKSDTK